MKLPYILFSIMFNKVKYKHFVFLIAVSFLALSSINCTKLRDSIDNLNSSIVQTNKGLNSLPTRDLTAEVKDNLSHLNTTIQKTNKILVGLPNGGLSIEAKKSLAELHKTIDDVNEYLKGLLNNDLPSKVKNNLGVLNKTIEGVGNSLTTLRIDGLSSTMKNSLTKLNTTIDDVDTHLKTLLNNDLPSTINNKLDALNKTIGNVIKRLENLQIGDLPPTIQKVIDGLEKATKDIEILKIIPKKDLDYNAMLSSIIGIVGLILTIAAGRYGKKKDVLFLVLYWLAVGIFVLFFTIGVCVLIVGILISLSFLFVISTLLTVLIAIIIFKVIIDVFPDFKILFSDIITGKKHHKLIKLKNELDNVLERVLEDKSNRFSKPCMSFPINTKENIKITNFNILTEQKERPHWELINNNESILPVSIEVTLGKYKIEDTDSDKDKGNDKGKGCDEIVEQIYILEEIRFDYILVKEGRFDKEERHNYKILKISAKEILACLKKMIEPECQEKWYSCFFKLAK